MEQRTLEGPWEEIALRGGELVGRRVRVIILDEPPKEVALDKALAPLISAAETLSGSLPKIEPSRATDAWADCVDEKYRRQGFKF